MLPDDLASIAEVADILGVTKRTAQRYAERPDFPLPIDTIAAGRVRVWRRVDVQRWGRKHLPLPRSGRPRKSSS